MMDAVVQAIWGGMVAIAFFWLGVRCGRAERTWRDRNTGPWG